MPPHSFAETLEQIETSFGRKPEDIFEEIAEEAVASGSVAQVHRCKLRQVNINLYFKRYFIKNDTPLRHLMGRTLLYSPRVGRVAASIIFMLTCATTLSL